MNKEEINKLLKDNPIKIIKFGDIEVPVEYLKQTTVNINGDDYIRLQQENKQLKDNWNELKKYLEENLYFYSGYQGEDREEDISIKYVIDKIKELEEGVK